MAGGSQTDTSLWLHNKLGTSNDSWTGGSIVSQLNPEILVKIQHCFMDLQPQVKLKLLLSVFHVGRRNLEAWKPQLDGILSVALEDSEPWVCMLAELMKTLPETGQLNADVRVPEANRKIFHDLLSDLKKSLKKNAEKQHLVLPLECHYLNKNAFLSVVGTQPQTVKHFTLRRKPKAAALRAELSNKSIEAANKLKSVGCGGFPMRKSTMPRKMSDMPMKGLPSRPLSLGGFRNPRVSLPNRPDRRKESGGVKMLDINEQPIGYADRKKRRKQEMEDAKKMAAEEAAKLAQEKAGSKQKEKQKKQAEVPAPTPDYAAALNPATPAPVSQPASVASAGTTTPAYAPPTPTPLQAPLSAPSYAPTLGSVSSNGTLTQLQQNLLGAAAAAAASNSSTVVLTQPPGPPQSVILMSQTALKPTSSNAAAALLAAAQQQQQQQSKHPTLGTTIVRAGLPQTTTLVKTSTTAAATPFLGNLEPLPPSAIQLRNVTRPTAQLPTQPLPSSVVSASQLPQLPQQPVPARIVQLPTQPIPQSRVVQMQSRSGAPILISQAGTAILQQRVVRPLQTQQTTTMTTARPTRMVVPAANLQPTPLQQQRQQLATAAQPPPPQRKNLTLTKDQMMEAQEMFKTANKVTRPEKALILGFMAGSRENPCPHLGNVVTIKLSENQENVPQTDGTYLTMIVETHFQMNYMTGEWKRIKKYRRIEEP